MIKDSSVHSEKTGFSTGWLLPWLILSVLGGAALSAALFLMFRVLQ